MSDEPKITLELRKHGAIFRIEGRDDAELEKGLAKALAFAKRNEKKIKAFGSDLDVVSQEVSSQPEENLVASMPDYMFADWFPYDSVSVADAIATLMYDLKRPLTTGQIAKILTKAWKPMDVRNVSKLMTMKGRYLAPYVYRDENSRGMQLTAAGRRWYENEVLPRLEARREL